MSAQMQEKDQKHALLQLGESSLKFTVETLTKREIIKSLNNSLSCESQLKYIFLLTLMFKNNKC